MRRAINSFLPLRSILDLHADCHEFIEQPVNLVVHFIAVFFLTVHLIALFLTIHLIALFLTIHFIALFLAIHFIALFLAVCFIALFLKIYFTAVVILIPLYRCFRVFVANLKRFLLNILRS